MKPRRCSMRAHEVRHRLHTRLRGTALRKAAACAASIPRSWSAKTAKIIAKYRKIHLPGHAEHEPWRAFQHLEKRYFEVGNLSWPVKRAGADLQDGLFGQMICNDRRWPESYRVMGLQGVEMILLGYNTPRAQSAGARSRPSRRIPQSTRDAGRRLPECNVGRWRRQMRASRKAAR